MDETTSRERPTLPASRAFVVQLSTEAEVSRDRWAGRVEHVVSGKTAHFRSLEALVAFIARASTPETREVSS